MSERISNSPVAAGIIGGDVYAELKDIAAQLAALAKQSGDVLGEVEALASRLDGLCGEGAREIRRPQVRGK